MEHIDPILDDPSYFNSKEFQDVESIVDEVLQAANTRRKRHLKIDRTAVLPNIPDFVSPDEDDDDWIAGSAQITAGDPEYVFQDDGSGDTGSRTSANSKNVKITTKKKPKNGGKKRKHMTKKKASKSTKSTKGDFHYEIQHNNSKKNITFGMNSTSRHISPKSRNATLYLGKDAGSSNDTSNNATSQDDQDGGYLSALGNQNGTKNISTEAMSHYIDNVVQSPRLRDRYLYELSHQSTGTGAFTLRTIRNTVGKVQSPTGFVGTTNEVEEIRSVPAASRGSIQGESDDNNDNIVWKPFEWDCSSASGSGSGSGIESGSGSGSGCVLKPIKLKDGTVQPPQAPPTKQQPKQPPQQQEPPKEPQKPQQQQQQSEQQQQTQTQQPGQQPPPKPNNQNGKQPIDPNNQEPPQESQPPPMQPPRPKKGGGKPPKGKPKKESDSSNRKVTFKGRRNEPNSNPSHPGMTLTYDEKSGTWMAGVASDSSRSDLNKTGTEKMKTNTAVNSHGKSAVNKGKQSKIGLHISYNPDDKTWSAVSPHQLGGASEVLPLEGVVGNKQKESNKTRKYQRVSAKQEEKIVKKPVSKENVEKKPKEGLHITYNEEEATWSAVVPHKINATSVVASINNTRKFQHSQPSNAIHGSDGKIQFANKPSNKGMKISYNDKDNTWNAVQPSLDDKNNTKKAVTNNAVPSKGMLLLYNPATGKWVAADVHSNNQVPESSKISPPKDVKNPTDLLPKRTHRKNKKSQFHAAKQDAADDTDNQDMGNPEKTDAGPQSHGMLLLNDPNTGKWMASEIKAQNQGATGKISPPKNISQPVDLLPKRNGKKNSTISINSDKFSKDSQHKKIMMPVFADGSWSAQEFDKQTEKHSNTANKNKRFTKAKDHDAGSVKRFKRDMIFYLVNDKETDGSRTVTISQKKRKPKKSLSKTKEDNLQKNLGKIGKAKSRRKRIKMIMTRKRKFVPATNEVTEHEAEIAGTKDSDNEKTQAEESDEEEDDDDNEDEDEGDNENNGDDEDDDDEDEGDNDDDGDDDDSSSERSVVTKKAQRRQYTTLAEDSNVGARNEETEPGIMEINSQQNRNHFTNNGMKKSNFHLHLKTYYPKKMILENLRKIEHKNAVARKRGDISVRVPNKRQDFFSSPKSKKNAPSLRKSNNHQTSVGNPSMKKQGKKNQQRQRHLLSKQQHIKSKTEAQPKLLTLPKTTDINKRQEITRIPELKKSSKRYDITKADNRAHQNNANFLIFSTNQPAQAHAFSGSLRQNITSGGEQKQKIPTTSAVFQNLACCQMYMNNPSYKINCCSKKRSDIDHDVSCCYGTKRKKVTWGGLENEAPDGATRWFPGNVVNLTSSADFSESGHESAPITTSPDGSIRLDDLLHQIKNRDTTKATNKTTTDSSAVTSSTKTTLPHPTTKPKSKNSGPMWIEFPITPGKGVSVPVTHPKNKNNKGKSVKIVWGSVSGDKTTPTPPISTLTSGKDSGGDKNWPTVSNKDGSSGNGIQTGKIDTSGNEEVNSDRQQSGQSNDQKPTKSRNKATSGNTASKPSLSSSSNDLQNPTKSKNKPSSEEESNDKQSGQSGNPTKQSGAVDTKPTESPTSSNDQLQNPNNGNPSSSSSSGKNGNNPETSENDEEDSDKQSGESGSKNPPSTADATPTKPPTSSSNQLQNPTKSKSKSTSSSSSSNTSTEPGKSNNKPVSSEKDNSEKDNNDGDDDEEENEGDQTIGNFPPWIYNKETKHKPKKKKDKGKSEQIHISIDVDEVTTKKPGSTNNGHNGGNDTNKSKPTSSSSASTSSTSSTGSSSPTDSSSSTDSSPKAPSSNSNSGNNNKDTDTNETGEEDTNTKGSKGENQQNSGTSSYTTPKQPTTTPVVIETTTTSKSTKGGSNENTEDEDNNDDIIITSIFPTSSTKSRDSSANTSKQGSANKPTKQNNKKQKQQNKKGPKNQSSSKQQSGDGGGGGKSNDYVTTPPPTQTVTKTSFKILCLPYQWPCNGQGMVGTTPQPSFYPSSNDSLIPLKSTARPKVTSAHIPGEVLTPPPAATLIPVSLPNKDQQAPAVVVVAQPVVPLVPVSPPAGSPCIPSTTNPCPVAPAPAPPCVPSPGFPCPLSDIQVIEPSSTNINNPPPPGKINVWAIETIHTSVQNATDKITSPTYKQVAGSSATSIVQSSTTYKEPTGKNDYSTQDVRPSTSKSPYDEPESTNSYKEPAPNAATSDQFNVITQPYQRANTTTTTGSSPFQDMMSKDTTTTTPTSPITSKLTSTSQPTTATPTTTTTRDLAKEWKEYYQRIGSTTTTTPTTPSTPVFNPYLPTDSTTTPAPSAISSEKGESLKLSSEKQEENATAAVEGTENQAEESAEEVSLEKQGADTPTTPGLSSGPASNKPRATTTTSLPTFNPYLPVTTPETTTPKPSSSSPTFNPYLPTGVKVDAIEQNLYTTG